MKTYSLFLFFAAMFSMTCVQARTVVNTIEVPQEVVEKMENKLQKIIAKIENAADEEQLNALQTSAIKKLKKKSAPLQEPYWKWGGIYGALFIGSVGAIILDWETQNTLSLLSVTLSINAIRLFTCAINNGCIAKNIDDLTQKHIQSVNIAIAQRKAILLHLSTQQSLHNNISEDTTAQCTSDAHVEQSNGGKQNYYQHQYWDFFSFAE